MKQCPFCGYSNYDNATECRKCQASLASQTGTVYESKALLVGPEKARALRDKALSMIILGVLIKVYWGGYGPWPVLDNTTLANLRSWLEPALLYGGGALYLLGWVLSRI